MVIKIEDKEQLARICGPNDIHLKWIADILGDRIFSYGNEIVAEPSDLKSEATYRTLISELGEWSASHEDADETALKQWIASFRNEDSLTREMLKSQAIVLPNQFKVYPRTVNQAVYLEAMHKFEINFAVGPAGTGKTFLAVAYALNQILTKKKKKLILTRPVVEAGESLGFLPGDLLQKINPYLRPIYDVMDFLIGPERVSALEERRLIEVAPLAYMRGRTFNHSVLLLDEAQNTTQAQMKLFLTRLGESSQAIIAGDITQIDLPQKELSGLAHARRLLSSVDGIHFTHFKEVDLVRNPLIATIIKAYENEKK